MRVVLLTQDEPLFLAGSIDYLLARTPADVTVAGCVVFEPSPLGKKAGLRRPREGTAAGVRPRIFRALRIALCPGTAATMAPPEGDSQAARRPALDIEGNINSPEALKAIRALKPDLLVSVAGNQLFRRPLLDLAPLGCLNVHTSLLPRYRGLMPTFWVLKNGEKETGVSVFLVDEGIDSGPIVVQRRVAIGTESLEELIRITKKVGMDAVWEAVMKVGSGNYRPIPNPAEDKSYFSFPTAADVRAFRAAGKRLY